MSDANRVNVALIVESTFGTTPSGPPTLVDQRITGESLSHETNTTTSQELRSDRQIADLVRTGISGAGDLNWELSYGAHDTLLEAALLSAAWTGTATVGALTTISFESIATSSSSYAKIKDSANGFGSLTQYNWLRTSGASTAANNTVCKIVSVAAGELEVIVANSTNDFTDEAAAASITVKQGDQITNGTTFRSFAIEKEYEDLSNIFEIFNGMAVDSMSMSVSPDAIITGAFSFMGKIGAGASATAGDGSNTAAAANDVMNAIDHVTAVLNADSSYDITEFTMALANNLRTRLQVATLGAVSVGTGTIDVNGTLNAYFNDNTELDKYRNFTSSSLALVFYDSAAGTFIIDFPNTKYSTGGSTAAGINQDVFAELNYQAIRHATEDITVRMVRIAV